MARDFDNFPTYDPIIKNDIYLSNIWSDFMATFIETLQGYLSEHGAFIPNMSLTERKSIQNPQEGQLVYIINGSDPIVEGVPRTAQLQLWIVINDIGQWIGIA